MGKGANLPAALPPDRTERRHPARAAAMPAAVPARSNARSARPERQSMWTNTAARGRTGQASRPRLGE